MVQPRATPPLVPPGQSGRCGLPSAEHQGARALPAVQRRRDHLGGREAVRRPSARPVDRIRGAVRIRGRADWPGRLAAEPREYAERLRGYRYVRLDTGREPGNAPAAFPGLRHRVMSDGEQWADVDRGSGYKVSTTGSSPKCEGVTAQERWRQNWLFCAAGRPCLTINRQRIVGDMRSFAQLPRHCLSLCVIPVKAIGATGMACTPAGRGCGLSSRRG